MLFGARLYIILIMACSHGSRAQPASDAAACIALAAKDCRASPTCKFAGKQCINKAAQVEEEILAPTEKSVPAVDICIVLNAQVCRAAPGCSFTAGVCHGKGRAPLTTTTTTTTTLGCLRRYVMLRSTPPPAQSLFEFNDILSDNH